MFVYVLNQHGEPLMPCRPQRARKLLKEGKVKVVQRTPFTIQLLFGSSGYRQDVVAGMDTGSSKVGCAVVTHGQVVYVSEVSLRNDVSRKMKQRSSYRRTRRGRLRYRPARWHNRASMRRKDRLAPSIQSKLDSHLREKRFVESILPISNWIVETANFDIHRIQNPDVSGIGYQAGPQAGFDNVKAYVLHRDGYRCQHKAKGTKHAKQLHVHHVIFRSQGGSDAPDNLVTLCRDCHEQLHAGIIELPQRKRRMSKTRAATHVGIVQARLKQANWDFTETFGYITKARRQQLGLPKSHAHDAIAVCCPEGAVVNTLSTMLYKRHVAAGDYRQTNGHRSEKKIPTGKLFGLRKFDLVKTSKGSGFVKGKRASGYFSIMDVAGKTIHAGVSVKKNTIRLTARTTTLVSQERRGAAPG